jgi:hypothetical protein
MRRNKKTVEERLVEQLSNLVSDLRIDLDQVGIYLAKQQPSTTYNRLMIIAESAEWEKENAYDRQDGNYLF